MASQAKGYLLVPVWCDDGVIKALVNDDGRLPVSIDGGVAKIDVNLKTSSITLPTQEASPLTSIIAQLETYIGAAYVKQAPIWGYTRAYAEAVIFPCTEAGTKVIATTDVDADYVRVVTNVLCYTSTEAVTLCFLRKITNATVIRLAVNSALGANTPLHNVGDIILKADDYLEFEAAGVVEGTSMRIYASGYEMKIG